MQVLTVDFKLLENELRVLINPAPALFLQIFQVSANAVSFAKLAESRPPLPAPHPWGQCSYHLPLLATLLFTRAELASLLVSVSWHAVAMLLPALCKAMHTSVIREVDWISNEIVSHPRLTENHTGSKNSSMELQPLPSHVTFITLMVMDSTCFLDNTGFRRHSQLKLSK